MTSPAVISAFIDQPTTRRGRPDVDEIRDPLLVRPLCYELTIEDVRRHGPGAPVNIFRQRAAPWPCPQGLRAHQTLDLVQPAGQAFCQNVLPDPMSTIGAGAADQARPHLSANRFIPLRPSTRLAGQPGMKARTGRRPARRTSMPPARSSGASR